MKRLIHSLQDVALSVGDILYIWVSEMKYCKANDGAWRLLNSVFCIEPNGKPSLFKTKPVFNI